MTESKSETQPPKIEFPCERYPIKVIGDAGEGFSSEKKNKHELKKDKKGGIEQSKK